ncbi:MAG: adenosylhomocysteinase [Myxococcales bacterium]|nr:adenosylhomocysteinase [Myxococcales bacterium]
MVATHYDVRDLGLADDLAAAEGHPSAVMDMSFANQALCVAHLAKAGRQMERTVHAVPEAIDREVASLTLRATGLSIDELTAEQRAYLASWSEGT